MKRYLIFMIALGSLFFFTVSHTWANKTSVSIEVVKSAKKGAEVTITIMVKHSGNTGFHHTEWVWLKINGQEVKRWVYDKSSLPPGGKFTLTYSFVLSETVDIEVQGNCNLHGSKGPVKQQLLAE